MNELTDSADSGDAVHLLEHAIAAQGGAARWAGIQRLTVTLRARFPLLMLKGVPPRLHRFRMSIGTCHIHVYAYDYPRPGFIGCFTGDRVWIEDADGEPIRERDFSFSADGKPPFSLWWDELDFLYFLGYAMWNYKNTPFMFQQEGFGLQALSPFPIGGGRWWYPLRVRFPLGLPTHSRHQTFYFDEAGLLRRLDYRADVISRWAIGAHLCDRHAVFDGLVYPTHRKVLGGWFPRHLPPFPKAVEVWIEDISIERKTDLSGPGRVSIAAVTGAGVADSSQGTGAAGTGCI